MSGGHHGCVRVGCASGCGRGRGRKGVGRAETVAQRHSQAKDNAACVRVGGRGQCVVCGLCERGANGLRVCVRVCVCVCVCVCLRRDVCVRGVQAGCACGHACGVWCACGCGCGGGWVAQRHSWAKDNAVWGGAGGGRGEGAGFII